jgi:hypothetical protein
MDHFESHELYNETHNSTPIPDAPLTKLPVFQRLRPYQKKQVRTELARRSKSRRPASPHSLLKTVAKFLARTHPNNPQKTLKTPEPNQSILLSDPDLITPIRSIINQFYRQQQYALETSPNTPTSSLRLLSIDITCPRVVKMDKYLGEDFGRREKMIFSTQVKRGKKLG